MSTDYTVLRAKFRADLVSKVAPFKATNDIRYYLNGIRVEVAGDRPGVYLVSSDGHRMMVAYDAEGMLEGDDGHGITIKAPDAFVRACRTKRGKAGRQLDVVITGRRLSVAPGWGGMFGEAEVYVAPGTPFINGKFSDWRRVIPDFSNLKPGAVNSVQAAYLADYVKVVSGNTYQSGAVRFWQAASNAVIVVQMEAYPELLGLLMPLRSKLEDDVLIAQMRNIIGARREGAQ